MKKFIYVLMLALAASVNFAEADTFITVNNDGETYQRSTYTHHGTNGCNGSCGYDPYRTNYIKGGGISDSDYAMDRAIKERVNRSNNKAYVGLITRLGYGYNYDAFTYGVSLLYHWDGWFGVTAGFDGYSFNKSIEKDGKLYSSSGLPLWDARFGFMFGKYFSVGGLLGKFNFVDDSGKAIQVYQDRWFINDDGTFMYGGFVTFIMPIGKYFGFNLDFAVTNKTGFNIGAGINFTFPIK